MRQTILKTTTYHDGQWEENRQHVIREQPVGLTVNNQPWLTFMCTPIELEALAIGFLYNEEVIESLDEIASVRVCPDQVNIDVWLNRSVKKPDAWVRTSGCSGGETSITETHLRLRKVKNVSSVRLMPASIGSLVDKLNEAQVLYRKSGGVHTSILSDGGAILLVAEDIGRHNTLDKLAGLCLLEKLVPASKIIVTTGRVSSEMIQKAGRMGAAVVISRTSPTSLSVDMAKRSGITLVGYARRDRYTIYSHPERISS